MSGPLDGVLTEHEQTLLFLCVRESEGRADDPTFLSEYDNLRKKLWPEGPPRDPTFRLKED